MKLLGKINLIPKEKRALLELKKKLSDRFPDIEIVLYGSRARGDYEKFSDIDLLILLDGPVNTKVEEEVIEIAFNIELEFAVVFGLLIDSKDFWNSPLARAMPIHRNIDREGLKL